MIFVICKNFFWKKADSRNSDQNSALKVNLLITLFDFWGIITKVEANRQFFMHIIMTVRVLDQSMWALQPMPELIRNTLVVKTNYQQHSMLGWNSLKKPEIIIRPKKPTKRLVKCFRTIVNTPTRTNPVYKWTKISNLESYIYIVPRHLGNSQKLLRTFFDFKTNLEWCDLSIILDFKFIH